MERAKRHEQVKALKESGLTFKEIAARLGVAFSTVTDAYYDPTGERARARKDKVFGVCIDCGAKTRNSGSPDVPERCRPCRRRFEHENRQWTPETIVAAIHRWADEHGGVPPVATDWNTTLAEARDGTPREPSFPSVTTVQLEFGSWNAAIAAAGFDGFAPGYYGRDGEYPEILAETVSLYRQGLSLVEVGKRLGVHERTVMERLIKAGEPRRSPWAWRQAA